MVNVGRGAGPKNTQKLSRVYLWQQGILFTIFFPGYQLSSGVATLEKIPGQQSRVAIRVTYPGYREYFMRSTIFSLTWIIDLDSGLRSTNHRLPESRPKIQVNNEIVFVNLIVDLIIDLIVFRWPDCWPEVNDEVNDQVKKNYLRSTKNDRGQRSRSTENDSRVTIRSMTRLTIYESRSAKRYLTSIFVEVNNQI